MDQIRDILFGDMEQMDYELRDMGSMLALAREGAHMCGEEDITNTFNHACRYIADLRAQLDSIRSAMVQITTATQKEARSA